MTALVDSFRNEAIEIMANGESILPLLSAFVTALAAQMPDGYVGINILDNPGRTFRHSVFPTLPEAFSSKLTGYPISTNRGSCGLAILSGTAIDVPDVANDPRFAAGWKGLFREYGLEALTTFPAPDKDGTVHGTIALIYDPQRPVTGVFRAHMPSGPAVTPPIRRGYGTLMMQGSLRNAFNGKGDIQLQAGWVQLSDHRPVNPKAGQTDLMNGLDERLKSVMARMPLLYNSRD